MGKNRIEREMEIIEKMTTLYCRRNHGHKELCFECNVFVHYACERLNKCKFGNSKPVCKNCAVHCYKASMRDYVKQIMHYSGPRMIFFAPCTTIRHLICSYYNGKTRI